MPWYADASLGVIALIIIVALVRSIVMVLVNYLTKQNAHYMERIDELRTDYEGRMDAKNEQVMEVTSAFNEATSKFATLVGNHLDHQESRMAEMSENQETIAQILERACISHNETVAAVNRLCAMWGNGAGPHSI